MTQGQSPEFQTINELTEQEPAIQGVCKDCGNGTLNNTLAPAFENNASGFLVCNRCSSGHLDLVVF